MFTIDKYLFLLFCLFTFSYAANTKKPISIEEKVGQLFMVYFYGETINEEAKRYIDEMHVGSFIYYNWANGLSKNPDQIKKLSYDLQNYAKKTSHPPLIIAIDQEGGLVARLKVGFTQFPGNAALGYINDPTLVYESAYAIGKELKEVGVNMNLAPVVDVNINPKNPVIGIRSFGEDPLQVTHFGDEAIRGYLDANIIPCMKHFPGHGDVTIDSHDKLPTVNKTIQELERVEFFPFANLSGISPAILTAHILYPQIDSKNCATLSSNILQKIVREKMGYEGVVITDSLAMKGVSKGYNNLEEVVLQAFLAGNDILLVGENTLLSTKGEKNIDQMKKIYQYMVEAVKDGRISYERLEESYQRIIQLKKQNRFFENINDENTKDISTILKNKKHEKIAEEIAYRSIEIRGELPKNLQIKNLLLIAPNALKNDISKTDLINLGLKNKTIFYHKNFQITKEDEKKIEKALTNSDYVIFCSYNAWKYNSQLVLIEKLGKIKPLALLSLRDAFDIDLVSSPKAFIATRSPSSISMQVASYWLQGNPSPLSISNEKLSLIGQRIWKNECNNRLDQLTFWNKNEEFPSMGIGHFIWPAKNYQGTFSKGRFHDVLLFFKEHNIKLPTWLENAKHCPWQTREEFYKEFHFEKMLSLRKLLSETIDLQAAYMVKRLNKAYMQMILFANPSDRKQINDQFFRIAKIPNGLYILIDYLNFKHEGIDLKERYNGQGWGLLQVLLNMGNKNLSTDQDFIETAKKLLLQRVENSAKEKNEKKWIPGWLNRLKTYEQSIN